MKKIKIGPSFFLLVIICLLSKNVLIIFNYLLALSLHELAHLWVAARKGYSLKTVKIDIFGIAVDLNEKIDNKDEFAVNIAGPIFNLMICVTCLAIYWLIPISYNYLNGFCFCNLVIAIFNLLPIYPLDGGKIFRGMVKSDKAYNVFNIVIKFILAGVSICAFIFTCFCTPNLLFLILAIFFLTSPKDNTKTMSIFKYRQNKHFDKVVILKIEENETLFNLIKQIKSHHYTIFYAPKLNKYFDEDNIIEFALKSPLTTPISEINC